MWSADISVVVWMARAADAETGAESAASGEQLNNLAPHRHLGQGFGVIDVLLWQVRSMANGKNLVSGGRDLNILKIDMVMVMTRTKHG